MIQPADQVAQGAQGVVVRVDRSLARGGVLVRPGIAIEPGLGDEIQAIKAGILEIADIHVVSKCDRSDANRTLADIKQMLMIGGVREKAGWTVPVVATSAVNDSGFDELAAKLAQAGYGAHDLSYEDVDAQGATDAHPWRRLLAQTRTLYRKDDLSAALLLGTVEPLALPHESYRLAFTPSLLASLYAGKVTDALLAEGKYLKSDDLKAGGKPTRRLTYAHRTVPLIELDPEGDGRFVPIDSVPDAMTADTVKEATNVPR